VILTLVHLRKDAMSISTYMKGAATLDGGKGSTLVVKPLIILPAVKIPGWDETFRADTA